MKRTFRLKLKSHWIGSNECENLRSSFHELYSENGISSGNDKRILKMNWRKWKQKNFVVRRWLISKFTVKLKENVFIFQLKTRWVKEELINESSTYTCTQQFPRNVFFLSEKTEDCTFIRSVFAQRFHIPNLQFAFRLFVFLLLIRIKNFNFF